jgi:GTP cyclohydrolase I
MVRKKDQRAINVTLTPQTVKRLEEVASESEIPVSDQATRALRLAMNSLFPATTDEQRREELKEAPQDFRWLWRQFIRGSQQKRRDKGQEDSSSASLSSEEGETLGEGEQIITVLLSRYRMERLQEISHQQGTSVSEEAARLIVYAMSELYKPMTKEEQEQHVEGQFRELKETWKDIFSHARKGK